MDLSSVRNAYSAMSEQYIGLFDGIRGEHEEDTALVRRHLTGLPGPVLDLGCGPGHWTAYLHSLGADVAGVDMVPEFIAHARAAHPGPTFHLGSMTEVDVPDHSLAGVLSWYSTIHTSPAELAGVLAGFRRLLAPSGHLVAGFFDSATRWPRSTTRWSRRTAGRSTSSRSVWPRQASPRCSACSTSGQNARTGGTPPSRPAPPEPPTHPVRSHQERPLHQSGTAPRGTSPCRSSTATVRRSVEGDVEVGPVRAVEVQCVAVSRKQGPQQDPPCGPTDGCATMRPISHGDEATMPDIRTFSSALCGALLVAAGLAVGLWSKGFCGSAFLPAPDPSGGGCAPLLESPRVLGVALLILGLVLAGWPLVRRSMDKGRR